MFLVPQVWVCSIIWGFRASLDLAQEFLHISCCQAQNLTSCTVSFLCLWLAGMNNFISNAFSLIFVGQWHMTVLENNNNNWTLRTTVKLSLMAKYTTIDLKIYWLCISKQCIFTFVANYASGSHGSAWVLKCTFGVICWFCLLDWWRFLCGIKVVSPGILLLYKKNML